MSDLQSRPTASRGRASARGGRAGFNSRGGAGGGRGGGRSTTNNADSSESTTAAASPSTYEEEGEIGQMKKKYSSSLPVLKELFPDWTDDDLIFALEDSDGDLENAIDRITEGNVSQWGEVKKKTPDRSRSKAAKEIENAPTEPAATTTTSTTSVRGGRGRGGFEPRGRGRGGRGGRGGRAASHVNGTRPVKPAATVSGGGVDSWTSAPVTDSWTSATTDSWTPAGTDSWNSAAAASASEWGAPPTEEKQEKQPDNEPAQTGGDVSNEGPKPSAVPEAPKKWTSLFAKPTPPPQKKPAPVTPAPAPAPAPAAAPEPAPAPASVADEWETPASPAVEQQEEKAPEPTSIPEPAEKTPTIETTAPAPAPAAPETRPSEESKHPADDLTETNLEQVPDASVPAPTATAASTIGSNVQDVAALSNAATPARQSAQGYPTSAYKHGIRTPGVQRRVMEQQEAVVMPGNHAVDRAAVQFGSMGLNGDAADAPIDEPREEAETRAQPPQHSPVVPRASLPPSTQAQAPTEVPAVSRPAPGLPPVPQVSAADTSLNDFGHYADNQKQYDLFAHQVTQPQPQVHEPFANQAPIQPTITTSSDYSPFYAFDQHRFPYNYYGTYGQDASAAQRAMAGFGGISAEVQPHIPTTQPPTRYGHVDTPNSGHTTPNPTLPAVTHTPTAQHIPSQAAAAAAAAAAHGGYGYGYPYYSNPHYASYMSQMTHGFGRNRPMYDDARRYDDHYMPHSTQFGYGSGYGPYGKAAMYGQPAFSYDHSSPANAAASFNPSMPGRESVYGRAGSAQPSENQQTAAGASAFGSGMTDVFGRGPAGFAPNPPIAQQQPAATEDATKGFDAAKAGGPSPSLAHANRPGSATNSVPGHPHVQSGLPPLHTQGQQAFGVYPHLTPQYGGLGGLGGHQAAATQAHHQGTGYGAYGAGFGNYYGASGRGGWGGNYGH